MRPRFAPLGAVVTEVVVVAVVATVAVVIVVALGSGLQLPSFSTYTCMHRLKRIGTYTRMHCEAFARVPWAFGLDVIVVEKQQKH